ncbi:hypothetical protein OF829_09030 [Sphingomonas sp. LB-2]|uniref:8-oxoguanine DNA glycosylase n=1 Tax=Sphingomonas caeni TaxID=2984949 RepID=UPI003873502F|nr:hypothetical protein [Sphingomonas caeni]
MHGDQTVERQFPSPHQRIAGHRIEWGRIEEIGSPAYWSAQSWLWELDEPEHYRLGRTLREEILACLLGGYGIPAEVGLAAYHRLRILSTDELRDADVVRANLTRPLEIQGRPVRYRFANQKSGYIAAAMSGMEVISEDLDDVTLRDQLVELPGIGLKTASWVVRNWRGSDQVSILDIHIIRAATGLGLFESGWQVGRDYRRMEKAYLRFCSAIDARASILDSVMWMTMRQLPSSIALTLKAPAPSTTQSNRRGKFDTGQLQLV